MPVSGPMTRHDAAISLLRRRTRDRFDLLRGFALLVATLIGLYVCYLLALPFLPALTWALTLAVLAAPLHRRFVGRLKQPSLSAAIFVILLAMLVLLP